MKAFLLGKCTLSRCHRINRLNSIVSETLLSCAPGLTPHAASYATCPYAERSRACIERGGRRLATLFPPISSSLLETPFPAYAPSELRWVPAARRPEPDPPSTRTIGDALCNTLPQNGWGGYSRSRDRLSPRFHTDLFLCRVPQCDSSTRRRICGTWGPSSWRRCPEPERLGALWARPRPVARRPAFLSSLQNLRLLPWPRS